MQSLGRGQPSRIVVATYLRHRRGATHHVEHVDGDRRCAAVGAETHVDACVEQRAHRLHTGAEHQIAPRVVLRARTRSSKVLDFLVRQPDRVDQRGARPQKSQLGKVHHHGLAIEGLRCHHLQTCFLNVDDDRQIMRVGEFTATCEKFRCAALRRRRRNQHANPVMLRMVMRQLAFQQREERIRRRSRLCAQLREQSGRENAVDLGEVIDDRAIHHREPDQRADARILVGLEDGLGGGGVDNLTETHVVDECGGAAAQRFERADQRSQVDLARRQFDRTRRAHVMHPQFERQVFEPSLVKMLMRMLMAIDEPRHQQAVVERYAFAVGRAAARHDGGDAFAFDHDIDAARLVLLFGAV